MAASVWAVVLRQKLFKIAHGPSWLSTIQHREASSAAAGGAATEGASGGGASSAGGRGASSAAAGSRGHRQSSRHPWDFKLSPLLAQLILTGSALSFMLYFFLFREESDVDTAIYRPIWERVPGISPDVAERMLEVDKQMGILYDAKDWEASLREYKKRYYANHPEEASRRH